MAKNYPGSASRKADVARKRLKRALNRELAKVKENQDLNKIAELNKKISESYAVRKTSEIVKKVSESKAVQESYSQIKKFAYAITPESLLEASEKYTLRYERKTRRRNEQFQYEINQASRGGTSELTKEEAKIFYSSTMNIWRGKPQGSWNKAIMDFYGTDSLEEAWEIVFSDSRVKEALKKARRNQQAIESEIGRAHV